MKIGEVLVREHSVLISLRDKDVKWKRFDRLERDAFCLSTAVDLNDLIAKSGLHNNSTKIVVQHDDCFQAVAFMHESFLSSALTDHHSLITAASLIDDTLT